MALTRHVREGDLLYRIGASMLTATRVSDVQSKLETWRDALVLAGGVIFFVGICAVALVGFHKRDHSVRGPALSVSTTGGATLHSSL